jgi:hypothetical protein
LLLLAGNDTFFGVKKQTRSMNNPPDSILGTQPIYDIEDAFNIEIGEDEAIEIYDMTLDEAVQKIMEMKSIQK